MKSKTHESFSLRLPGWNVELHNEILPCVYQVKLRDNFGRTVDLKYTEGENGLLDAYNWAFGMERKLSKNFPKFLYDICELNINELISHKEYSENSNKWKITSGDNTLSFYPRTSLIILTKKKFGLQIPVSFTFLRTSTYKQYTLMIRILCNI